MNGLCEVLVAFSRMTSEEGKLVRRITMYYIYTHIIFIYMYMYIYIYNYIYIYYVCIPSPESPVDMVYEWDSDI